MAYSLRKVLAVLLLGAAPPAAASPAHWASLGEWIISYYPSTGGCLAFARSGQTAFFIGYDTISGIQALDITVLDDRWDSIETGSVYPVTVAFGNEPPWTIDMAGVVMDGAPGLNIVVDAARPKAAQIIAEFRRERSMTWAYGETELVRFSLRGSRRAFDAILDCQRHHANAPATRMAID